MSRFTCGGHLRVAIVGLGPKGLFALERLLHHARREGAALDVDVFEPHPVPAAGPVYDPGQPAYLLMNFAADQLDMWCADNACVATSERLDFVAWRRRSPASDEIRSSGCDVTGSAELDEARYPPRAQVGRYLAEGLELLRSRLPAGTRVTLRPLAVDAVCRSGASWKVVGADRSTREYEEVLVATGHRAPSWPDGGWEHAAPLVPAVFPISRRLSHDAVAPGSAVAVRGFALTFIDAALALTEGRGGTFASDGHPYRLRYVPSPSGEEPAVIRPFSRSGRPMLAKPQPALAAGVPSFADIARSGREQIHVLPVGFSLDEDLVAILAATAGACLIAAGARRCGGEPLPAADVARDPIAAAHGREASRQSQSPAADLARNRITAAHDPEASGESQSPAADDAWRWLAAAACGAAPPFAHGSAIELERSLAVGAGLRSPDLQWALGECWRGVYPALVERLAHGGLAASQWPAFHRLAAQMERIAFGPPPENAAKLLALVAAGRVDLTHVTGGFISTDAGVTTLRSPLGSCAVDVVVNAVLAEPGARGSDGGLLGSLVRDGHARIAPAQRGLEVSSDLSVIARDGRESRGLAAIGRPTEGSVIGNDTLSRRLHPHADGWARRVARRAAVDVDVPREAA